MPDLDHMIRDELRRAVDRAPTPPSVRDITRPRVARTEPVRVRRRRTLTLQVAAAAAVVVALVVATVAVVDSSGGDEDGGGVVATSPDGAAFVETVDWPHYLPTWLPAGAELQLTEEIRPGGLPGWTTQSFVSAGTGGTVLLAIEPAEDNEGALDATETVQGEPIMWLDDQGASDQAAWSWPTAQVLVYVNGTEPAVASDQLLEELVPRGGDPVNGFDVPAGNSFVLSAEHVNDGGQPAITRAWFGTADRIDVQVQAVAPSAAPATLDLVALGGATEPRTIAGREVLVSTFGEWTTVAWFDTDGTFVSAQARAIADTDLELLVAGIGRVDQPTWTAAVDDLSDRVALAGAGLCVVGQADLPCAALLTRRDGGPYLVGPTGLLEWTPITSGYDFADVVVDGTWWMIVRIEGFRSSPGLDVQLDVEGEVVVPEPIIADSPNASFAFPVHDDIDRVRVIIDGFDYGERWRPSS